jgi:uncharacterized protein (TIGR02996 family)
MEEAFLQALHADPCDETTWLALADWLEDDGQTRRSELTRLTRRLRLLPDNEERSTAEQRVQELLQAGVQPCVPLLTNSTGMVFSLILPGTFRMGSPDSEDERLDDEGPVHEVEITRPFYLGVYQVTQEQYGRVMGANPSLFQFITGMDTIGIGNLQRIEHEGPADANRRHIGRLGESVICNGSSMRDLPFNGTSVILRHSAGGTGALFEMGEYRAQGRRRQGQQQGGRGRC